MAYPRLLDFGAARVGAFLICKPGQIVHTGAQNKRDPFALLEGEIPLSALDFGVVALIDSRKHLHLYLCQMFFFS